jgi:Zn-dependent protease
MEAARASRQAEVLVLKTPSSYEHTISYGQPRMPKGRVYFSPKELKHLTVAGLLVVGIGFSSVLYYGTSVDALAGFALILTASFFAHEIAHKVIAQRRGLWAEFRLTLWGSVLTLVSFISPLFKIISPGAVMISGSAGMREMGKISLAGPATNIVVSAVLLGLSPFVPSGFVWAVMLGAFLNAFMAVFNLIPFGIFDGFKIYSWDKKIWALVFAVSLALAIVAYILSGF